MKPDKGAAYLVRSSLPGRFYPPAGGGLIVCRVCSGWSTHFSWLLCWLRAKGDEVRHIILARWSLQTQQQSFLRISMYESGKEQSPGP